MNLSIILSLFVSPLFAQTVAPPLPDERVWIVIRAETKEERTRIASCGVSLESFEQKRVSGVADPKALDCLKRAGILIESQRPLASFDEKDFPPQDSAYHDLKRLNEEIRGFTSANPDLAKVSSIGTSVEGRPITAVRLSAGGGSDKPGVLFIGTHHAREHLSTEVPLLMAKWMAENRGKPEVAALLASREIYFIPLLNPDGAEYDVATGNYAWQRKNRRRNGDGSYGVDLNRNYDYGWDGPGSSTRPGAETYRGPAPFSEPETQAVRDFLKAHPNIRTMATYHSYGDMILYPWSNSYDPIPDPKVVAAYKSMSEKMGKMTGYTPMQSSELYASGGDTCDWAWSKFKIFCFTFELSGGGFYPGPKAIGPAVEANLKAGLYLMEMADDPYRSGEPEPPRVAERPGMPEFQKRLDGLGERAATLVN